MLTILGNVRESIGVQRDWALSCDVATFELNRSLLGLTKPGQNLDKLGLSIALDSADPDDLAPSHGETQAVDRVTGTTALYHQIMHLQNGLGRVRGWTVHS